MNMIAIDYGFGNVKYRTSVGVNIFQTAFSRDLKTYGEDAIKQGSVVYPKTIEDLINLYPTVIDIVISQGKEYPDMLGVGLPLESWKNRLNRLNLMEKIYERFNVKAVHIYPQAAAVGFVENGNSLVIDIGFNTVIVCLVSGGKLVWDKTYYQAGAIELANGVNRILSPILSKVGKTLDYPTLLKTLLKGTLQVGFDVYDISSEVQNLKSEYIRETLTSVIQEIKVKTGLLEFDRVYIIGGLAKDVEINSKKIEIIIPQEPIYANVNAFYDLLAREQRQE